MNAANDAGTGEGGPEPVHPNSPFGAYMGLEFVEAADDCVRARLVTETHHQNPQGMIHGGVFVSLADNVATAMANRAHNVLTGEGKFMVGIDLHASMIANQPGGTIVFEARPIRVGRRVAFIRTVVTGDNDRVLAEVRTTHVPA